MASNIKPIKERVEPNDIPSILESSIYPKPRWMVNNSVYDTTWLLARNGIDISFYDKNENAAPKLNFDKSVSYSESLTDIVNEALLIDIQHSLLYLDARGKITRSERIRDVFNSTINLIYHANENRISNNKPLIRSLEHIKLYDLKSYLLAFSVDKELFNETLENIILRWTKSNEIDWDIIRNETNLTRREFLSLKNRILKYFKSDQEDVHFIHQAPLSYAPQYKNANTRKFELDINLIPSESSISNEISKLEAMYTSRSAQKYKFQHSPMKLFNSGSELFNELKERDRTALMPVNVQLHAISSALYFVRVYGNHLVEYVSELFKAESDRIKELGIQYISAYSRHYSDIKQYAFNNTEQPAALKNLNITSFEKLDSEKSLLTVNDLKSSISVGIAIKLYVAAMWILISGLVASRTTSILTLKRGCFVQSPIDGLFDIVLRIPKTSERFELEDVHRPIPDLIYDYGLQFATLSNTIEERRHFYADENDTFLFGNALSYRSITAGSLDDGGKVFRNPLSDDYIKICLTMFQDWSDSPLIDNKRWYFSTHQFRRIFAVLYFNFSDNSGLDELSWFMGHSNLDQTFHYAEVAPTDEWIEEAENTIVKIGANIQKQINADETITNIIGKARSKTKISTILEPLVKTLIDEHKKNTGQVVRFYKLEDQSVFFYFCNSNGE